jgi:hypothetical protein
MRGAWYIVDVYCFLCALRAIITAVQDRDNPTLLAITAVALLFVFFLAWRTYRGNRLASRILSLYIIANVISNVWPDIVGARTMNVYRVYMLALFAYLFIGAIKLWRIKELPTRFTDPPAGPPAHA